VGTNSDKHARQTANRNRLDQARRQVEAETRRRRLMAVVGGLLALVVVILAIVLLTGDDSEDEAADGTTTTTAVPDESGLPAPEPGATLTEPTECPPAEGAEERVQVFAGPPPECIDPAKTYTATFATSHGEFTATLDAEAAPASVNNFVVLSRYRYFDSVPFHRIVPGFVIQAGDGDGAPWGNNELGYEIEDELPSGSEAYTDYSLAMANAGPDTNGSQFFVVLPGGGPGLGPDYSRFGEVTEGQDVVDAIGQLGDQAQQPTEAVVIESVTITES
jgi:cyclophilin family peptidyl-prolyl cis-trans isomerase